MAKFASNWGCTRRSFEKGALITPYCTRFCIPRIHSKFVYLRLFRLLPLLLLLRLLHPLLINELIASKCDAFITLILIRSRSNNSKSTNPVQISFPSFIRISSFFFLPSYFAFLTFLLLSLSLHFNNSSFSFYISNKILFRVRNSCTLQPLRFNRTPRVFWFRKFYTQERLQS